MVSPKQMREMMRNPMALVNFQATGQAPRTVRPESPLITLLEQIDPRDRVRIVGVRVDALLGYVGSRQFHTAEQALRWAKPDNEMIEGRSWPAESNRDKRFSHRLYLEQLLDHAASYPEGMLARYPQISWMGPRNPGGRLMEELKRSQLAVDMNRIDDEGHGRFRFSGNFAKVSHVFNFRTSLPEVVEALTQAIIANRARPDYEADVDYREAAAREYHAGLEATGKLDLWREAKREWQATRPVRGGFIHGRPLSGVKGGA